MLLWNQLQVKLLYTKAGVYFVSLELSIMKTWRQSEKHSLARSFIYKREKVFGEQLSKT